MIFVSKKPEKGYYIMFSFFRKELLEAAKILLIEQSKMKNYDKYNEHFKIDRGKLNFILEHEHVTCASVPNEEMTSYFQIVKTEQKGVVFDYDNKDEYFSEMYELLDISRYSGTVDRVIVNESIKFKGSIKTRLTQIMNKLNIQFGLSEDDVNKHTIELARKQFKQNEKIKNN